MRLLIVVLFILLSGNIYADLNPEMLRKARLGDSVSQLEIGKEYIYGMNVERNFDKAVEWLNKSAQQDNSEAQYLLGTLYHYENKHKNVDKSIYWLEKSSEADNADALFLLGQFYYIGESVKQDVNKAKVMFSKAVEIYLAKAMQGETAAQVGLAMAYINGYGVDKNLAQAEKWLKSAAEKGDQNAVFYLNELRKASK